MMVKLRIVEEHEVEPDPEIERMLDYLVKLSKIADTVYVYVGPARKEPGQTP